MLKNIHSFKIIFSIAILFFAQVLFSQSDSCLHHVKLGISFPPITNIEQQNFSQTHLSELNVKLIRSGEDWSLRETTQGTYNWGPLETRMNWINENSYSLLLTIQSNGPDWACDPSLQNELSCVFTDSVAFRKYIDTLLIRYGNSIDKIQFGNEWHSENWYIGSAKDFIRANNTIWESVQENASHIDVVLGGFASGTMTVLAACYGYIDSVLMPDAANYYDLATIQAYCNDPDNIKILHKQDSILRFCHYDIIDMHLYDDVQLWPLYYHIMDSITSSLYPIIVSEMGGPNLINEQPYSDEFQAQRLYQYIKCVDSLNISEAYFFKLVDGGNATPYHQESGLIDNTTLIEKSAYYLFKTMNNDCSPNEINNLENESPIYIYPNPASENIHISQNYKQIEIFDLSGKQVFESSENNAIVSIRNIPNGLYILKTKLMDDSIVHQKMLILR